MTVLDEMKTWSRDARKAMDNARGLAFQPTPEEVAEQEAQIHTNKVNRLTTTLAQYGITFVESSDYSALYHAYIFNYPDMSEWLGPQETMISMYEDEITNHNDFDSFYNFVSVYEA